MTRRRVARRAWLAACAAGVASLAWRPAPARAQGLGLARASAVKAAFLYKFGSFVEWPADAFVSPTAPLRIGVYGDDAVASELELITQGRDVGGRPVVLLRVRDVDAMPALHIFFAGGPRASRMREMIAAAQGPVLTVADGSAGARADAVLYFTEDQGRVRFNASLPAAQARGLRLSAKLLAVAHMVEGR